MESERVIAQLRIYTVNKGQMDSWLKTFKEEVAPLVKQHGMGIAGTWVDRERERFVWIRTYQDEADIEKKESAFYNSPEWKQIVDRVRGHLARREISVIEPVDTP